MDSNSDSEEGSVGGSRLEWEVVASDPDSGFSDSNGNGHDGQMHEQDVDVHLQHFLPPSQQETAESTIAEAEDSLGAGKEESPEAAGSEKQVSDWIEPSTSTAGIGKEEHELDGSGHSKDLDLLSSLVSSVLESGKKETGCEDQGEREPFASLEREILSEAGFSSLVPSDIHGNVLRPEEQEQSSLDDANEDGFGEDSARRSWRQTLANWRDYIRRASTLWSITIAAALMGLVIIGQRWHHERWQNHQLRLQLCYKDEKISQLLFQIARLKEAVAGRRRVPVIKASSN